MSPKPVITREKEKYVFVGFTKDTSAQGREYNKIWLNNEGRKIVFTEHEGNPKVLCIYASNRYYSRLNQSVKPIFGKGKIKEDE
jgi:hypothetical protein